MRSSTSSSSAPVGPGAEPVVLRPVPALRWPLAATIALVGLVVAYGAWEAYWRAQGMTAGYRNSAGQWAEVRRRVDRNEPGATVLIGSSRTQFDVDLDTWQAETGVLPIQLALEGSNPLPILTDLASDEDFRGLLVVGITPPLIMMPGIGAREDAVERYLTETPAQWLSTKLSYGLETTFAGYNWDTALFLVLARQNFWPKRSGFVAPPPEVRRIDTMDRNRSADLWSRVETDSAYNEIVTGTWRAIIESLPDPPPEDVARDMFGKLLDQVASDVEAIRARGGEVVFIRLPSSGFFREVEAQGLPRERVWEPLLEAADAVGVHFEDYPELQVPTPEWSHISARDKPDLTRALVRILRERLAERGIERPELGP